MSRELADNTEGEEEYFNNPLQWAFEHYSIDNKPYTLTAREYLREILECNHADITIQKSAQSGLSEMAVIRAMHFAKYYGENVFYGMPIKEMIGQFVQGRVDPRLEESDYLSQLVKKTNNIGLKRIGDKFIYFRSTGTRRQIITVDAGFVIYDELDEMIQKHISVIEKRTGASRHKFKMKLSTPTYTNYGINYYYLLTDQREWHIKCEKCKKWQVLDFFKNIFPKPTRDKEIKVDQLEVEPHYVCAHCGSSIENTKPGKWIPKNPKIKKRGYLISKLFTNQLTAKELWELYNTTKNLKEFYNSDLGLAFDVEGGNLTDDNLRACEESYDTNVKGCHMGVDVGNDINVIISQKVGNVNRRVCIKTVKSFEELDILMKQFDVHIAVVDGLPETRKAKEFAERFAGRVYLAYYNLKGVEVALYDDDKRVVRINRTLSMDYAANAILTRETRLPLDSENILDFYAQMKSPQKIEVLNEKTGNKEFQYLEGSAPDHYFHANNYCEIAMEKHAPVSVDASKVAVVDIEEDDYEYYDEDDFSGGSF